MKYENTFKAIDQILWKEQGCGSELDYLEQKSWMLFLKYLDDLETEREDEAELEGKTYKRLVSGFYRWSQWATPKKKDSQTGKMVLDTVNAMSGDDLVEFVDQKLFPYLKDFQNTAASTDTLEYKIGEIFGELHNKIRSGFNMREIINMIDELHFQSAEDKHEMTVLYESNIQRMGNAGRNGGEYYTPRPLIRSIIQLVDPKIGETVYDPACGSAGFLCNIIGTVLLIYRKNRPYDISSMSAPAVAGIVALWLQAKPDLTPEEVIDVLAHTSRHYDPSLTYPNNEYGYGEIDAYKGLLYILHLTNIEGLSTEHVTNAKVRPMANGDVSISIPDSDSPTQVRIYNTNGQCMMQAVIPSHTPDYTISNFGKKGIFAVQVGNYGSTLIRIE